MTRKVALRNIRNRIANNRRKKENALKDRQYDMVAIYSAVIDTYEKALNIFLSITNE